MIKYSDGVCKYCGQKALVDSLCVRSTCYQKKNSAHQFYIEAQKIKKKCGLPFDEKVLEEAER